MKSLLFINACVREEHSRTLRVANAYLNSRKKNEEVTVIERNLNKEALTYMTNHSFDSSMGEQRPMSTKLAEEFAKADEIVLAAPFWEFLFPAMVNCYFEAVSIVGQTFQYTDTGSVGLCRAEHFTYIYTAGDYISKEDRLSETYLEKLTKLYGINKFSVIVADGLDIQGNDAEKIVSDVCVKMELRRTMSAMVQELDSAYCRSADEELFQQLIQLEEYQNANTVFCYVGKSNEINTIAIIQHLLASGKQVAIPKCIQKGIMEAYSIQSLDDLECGFYGILEPKEDKQDIISPNKIDLAIIPCLSASSRGERLGYGGGFYDRYLQRTDAYRLLLCRERIICEDIPVESHDQKMDMVLTEERILRLS